QPDANQLHPISRPSERFNDPDHLNRPTSVCGIGIYRDDLWGASFEGNAFVCEPVHNLVRRFGLLQQGALVRARKFESEQSREFMASSDAWHRPVQVRCGPDGGLWVVDMYRFLVEHPRWITPQRLASLDMRAGADMGRLFRIGRAGVPFREVRDLTRMQIGELAGSMDTPNGVERDRVQLALFHRADPACVPSLSRVANESRYPAARAQALAALAMGGWLEWNLIEGALRDPDHRVAAMALRFCERFLQQGASVPGGLWSQLAELENNPAPVIQQQLALSLGQSPDLRAGKLLARLAQKHAADPWMRASILSSAPPHISALMESTADWVKPGADPAPPILIFMEHLLATALAHSNPHAAGVSTVNRWVESDGTLRGWRLSMVARWVETTKGMIPGSLGPRMMGVRETAADSSAAIPDRRDAVRLLGWMQEQRGLDLEVLGSLASSSEFPELRSAALERLGKSGDSTSSIMLLKDWGRKSPALRTEALQVLLSRDLWIHQVLEWIRKGDMAAQDLSPAQRTALLKHPNQGIRELAQASLPPAATDDRQQIVLRYSNLPSIQPPAAGGSNGPALFQANCASCHRFKGNGFRVGPDLDSLASRDEPFWIQQILNPNAIVEPRFVAYQVSLTDGREVSGVIESESAASLQLAQPGGSPLSILRSEISVVRPMSLSLMPEGLEESLSREAMASLLAYLRAPTAKEQPSATRQPSAPPRDPKALAAILLDARVSDAEKEGAAATHPHLAFAILQELVRELGDDSKEEYRRIPWMWRVSLMAGRRADHGQLRRMIDLATPQPNERLRDWQAVVIGGGVINGLSQAGIQPGPRIHDLIAGDRALLARWEQALKLAALMAESSTVPEGTRYDAIRMMGMETWTARGDQLRKFLGLTTHPELQMGAVSALSDMPEPEAGLEIAKAFSLLTPSNLQLAIDAALQRADRTLIFLKAVDEGRLDKKHITPERLEKLRSASDPKIRTWARAVSRE
ncbi:MAG: c-type cytochrome, partial [Verrucomicrobia bacterium]|nr:c-type cytochrome [Verrucomicrobiota bacterium]